MEVTNPSETSGVRDKAEKPYWRVVNLVWLLFAFMMLLAMCLLFGPDFWREFFK